MGTDDSYAEEAELWTSLAINSWVIFGALIFLLVSIWRTKLSFLEQLKIAVSWSYVALSILFTIGFLILSIATEHPASRFITVPFTAFWIFGAVVLSWANLTKRHQSN